MAIDDNTLYGLTGAQVKELPERIEAVRGLARVLTTADYNWPTTGTKTSVALWLLEPGIYVGPEDGTSVAVKPVSNIGDSMGAGFPNLAIVLKNVSDSNQRGEVLWMDGNGALTQYYSITASGAGSSRVYLRTADVANNLTSTSTNAPLSAAQGKALKDLIDAIVVPTQTSDLTNDGSDGTSTYVEADELATVATSGNYNDLSNTPTIPTVPTNVSAFTNDAGYQTASNVSSAVATETTARQTADANLQSQIDGISASSDVKDIVGTKAALNAYDTSTLGNNDIIKVLQDESQNNETTYYRWSTTTSTFTLIGEEGPYYTKSETDTLLNAKANTSSLATVATSGSYNDLSNKPTIPTVNNATLTIQANGTTVNSFTANASSNVTANIPSATTSRYGVTELSTSTSSTSTTLAATPSAVKSAYDLANGKATITMTTTDPGEGATLAANNYVAVYGISNILDMFYPVGSYYETSDTTFDPNTSWGGTWVEDSAGRVTVAKDTGIFSTVGGTGGEETHTLIESELPNITGAFRMADNVGRNTDTAGFTDATGHFWLTQWQHNKVVCPTTSIEGGSVLDQMNFSFGSNGAHNNLQPYIVVKRWHRVS